MKNLLIAQDLQPMMMGAMHFLHRSDIAVHTAATNEDILRLHLEKNGHLIATHPSLPGMSCKTLCDIVRRGETLKKVSILLLCDKSPKQQELARHCGVNAVVTRPVDAALFTAKVRQLLDVPARHSYRVLLNVDVEGMHDHRPAMCHSEDLSASGMLIRTRETLAPGSSLACSFYLPDGLRISAHCSVVRAFKKEPSEEMTHYGLAFRTCTPGAREAIAAFVAKESHRQTATTPPAARQA